MAGITQEGSVWTLDLGADENRFTGDWLEAMNRALDEVSASDSSAVLITRGSGKFFSNGLDVSALAGGAEELSRYVDRVHALYSRLLTLPIPTVAAINGHAFGAGAMLALAHDFRVMRADRGFFCFPEVDINIPFTPGMNALITAKLTAQAQSATMLTGRRLGGADALRLGIVDATAAEADLFEVATSAVADLAGKDRGTLGSIKSVLHAPVVAALAIPHS